MVSHSSNGKQILHQGRHFNHLGLHHALRKMAEILVGACALWWQIRNVHGSASHFVTSPAYFLELEGCLLAWYARCCEAMWFCVGWNSRPALLGDDYQGKLHEKLLWKNITISLDEIPSTQGLKKSSHPQLHWKSLALRSLPFINRTNIQDLY